MKYGRKLYFGGICENCGSDDIEADDLDFRFKGCQDEYYICNCCHRAIYVKVRYNKVCKVEYTQGDVF